MKSSIILVDVLIYGLAVAKYMMIFSSFGLPEKMLILIKKTKNDWLRMLFARVGMFFDCPICLSVLSATVAVIANSLNHIINLILAISILGLFIKKKLG